MSRNEDSSSSQSLPKCVGSVSTTKLQPPRKVKTKSSGRGRARTHNTATTNATRNNRGDDETTATTQREKEARKRGESLEGAIFAIAIKEFIYFKKKLKRLVD
jgi:hypothetical protein